MRFNINVRLTILDAIYKLHESFINQKDFSCRPGCDVCCTRDLTATTLEGWYLVEYCRQAGRRDLVRRLGEDLRPGLRPQLTINGFAAACIRGRQAPGQERDLQSCPCPLLEEGRCAVYPARPLGCRAMVSVTVCRSGGQARMPDFVLTVNTLLQQVVEQLDLPGFTGNLADVIRFLEDTGKARAYFAGHRVAGRAFHLLSNQPACGLMVPPEHRGRIKPLLDSLQNIFSAAMEKPAPEGA